MTKARDIASAAPAPAGVSTTELGYVDGVTSAIQTQINTKTNIADEFAAGKNKIINGDFGVNQRSFTSVTSDNFGFDRWRAVMVDGTVTYSAQTFTTGAAPVAGYEGKNFARIVTTGQTLSTARANFNQNMEDVRTLAGQTATLSFWAKAATGTPKIAIELNQNFGTGGSPSTAVPNYIGQVTLSTSWVRYSVTMTVPSISGKTIGTNPDSSLQLNLFVSAGSNLNARTGSLGIQSNTFDLWGVQFEAANTASNFQTASGTMQGELALCQRYFVQYSATSSLFTYFGNLGMASSVTNVIFNWLLSVPMRTAPTAIFFSNLAVTDLLSNNSVSVVTFDTNITNSTVSISATTTSVGLRTYYLRANNSSTAYIGFSAEL